MTISTGALRSRAESSPSSDASRAKRVHSPGKRNPYDGKLGVVAEGALADLLLVDGNPLEDITLLANPEKNLAVIMKDGTIFKNKLD